MKRFLTTGFLGAILGIVIGGAPADASLISRSFLDQALTDYATNTALDLKANKADVTDLSDKIGTLPSGDILISKGLAFLLPDTDYTYPTSIGDFMVQMYNGYLGLSGLAEAVYRGNEFTGQTDTAHQVKGLRQITDEIGTLPSGEILPSKGLVFLLPEPPNSTYPTSIGDFMGQMYSEYLGLSGLANAVYYGNAFMGQTDTALQVKGLRQITDEIGTLSRGPIGNSPAMGELFRFTQGTDTPVFPNSLSDLINQLYGSNGGGLGAISALLYGFDFNFSDEYDGPVGVLPAMELGLSATAKIGDLPSGNFPLFPGYEFIFSAFNQPLTYPTSLAELINAIYGNSETGAGLLRAIIAGFPFDTNGDGITDSNIGTLPNFNLAKNANNLATTANTTATAAKTAADANTAKIGDLPTEYATVGAALTAIKGIAEEAKAAALAAIPDPKTEGSTGKFVLTVDIVGDNATYRWEKIDREDETTTTTE